MTKRSVREWYITDERTVGNRTIDASNETSESIRMMLYNFRTSM